MFSECKITKIRSFGMLCAKNFSPHRLLKTTSAGAKRTKTKRPDSFQCKKMSSRLCGWGDSNPHSGRN